jgi:DNA-binding response OmpR family regulator
VFEAARARVLICDDNDLVRGLLVSLLARDGHDVRQSRGVQDALVQIEREAPDIILLDLHLRSDSGLDVLKRVRGDPSLQSTPVILLSGDFDGVNDGYADQFGADAVLPKPFDTDEVSETVRALLAARPAR